MCGIAGIFNSSTPAAELACVNAMQQTLLRRGPDAGAVKQLGNTVFAHRRLAIIDLDNRSDQPMSDENKRCMISFNGEIYNYRELKQELEAQGVVFTTSGDTEVILQLYLSGGVEALGRLDGMFAFAIYDRRNDSLVLMRDIFGKKPLYYFIAPDGAVVFASTLQALKAHRACPDELDSGAIRDFLALSYIPHTQCVYKNVYQLPPASWMVFNSSGKAECQRYWQIDYQHKLDISFEDASDILQKKLHRAVAKRLIADVPCGIFLSGGVDSAAVAALAAAQSSTPLDVFTIGFNESRYDERCLAGITADFINNNHIGRVKHHTRIVDCRSFELLQELVQVYGEPFADFSMLPTALLSEFAAAQRKVVLSGDGADEIFGGYERYYAMRYCALLDALLPAPVCRALAAAANRIFPDHGKRSALSKLCRFLRLAATPEHLRYIALMSKSSMELEQQLYGERLQTSDRFTGQDLAKTLLAASTSDPAERYAECDLTTYLPDDILVKVDRASMHYGLEVRSPFLDKDVAEFAASLPFDFKQHGCDRKRILKRALNGFISPEILNKPKRGFAVPIGEWFRAQWKENLRSQLLDGRLVSDGWIKKNALEAVIDEHNTFKRDHSELLGNLLMLACFLHR